MRIPVQLAIVYFIRESLSTEASVRSHNNVHCDVELNEVLYAGYQVYATCRSGIKTIAFTTTSTNPIDRESLREGIDEFFDLSIGRSDTCEDAQYLVVNADQAEFKCTFSVEMTVFLGNPIPDGFDGTGYCCALKKWFDKAVPQLTMR